MDFIPYAKHLIDDDDIKEVVSVLKSDWITSGPKVEEFEYEVCRYLGAKYGVAVNSGTSALDIAVQALGLEEGDEIITTPFTFVATPNSIIYNRCRPVFADIKKDSFNIDPESVRRLITEKTRAILYVDYAGQPCDIAELKKIADEHDLFLIEDAAHALGAEYDNKKIGTFADITTFSFHPVKPITTGEGGMAVTNDASLHEKLKILRNHGIDKDGRERFGPDANWSYDMKLLGRNYRITDFQCALGLSQLKKLDEFIRKREKIAQKYNRELATDGVQLPKFHENTRSGWHLYAVLLPEDIDRDRFFNLMREKKIGANVHYIPCYKHSYYVRNNITGNCPVAEEVFSRIITLPLHQGLDDDETDYVISSFKKSLEEVR